MLSGRGRKYVDESAYYYRVGDVHQEPADQRDDKERARRRSILARQLVHRRHRIRRDADHEPREPRRHHRRLVVPAEHAERHERAEQVREHDPGDEHHEQRQRQRGQLPETQRQHRHPDEERQRHRHDLRDDAAGDAEPLKAVVQVPDQHRDQQRRDERGQHESGARDRPMQQAADAHRGRDEKDVRQYRGDRRWAIVDRSSGDRLDFRSSQTVLPYESAAGPAGDQPRDRDPERRARDRDRRRAGHAHLLEDRAERQ